jgi:hypothetical protein
MCDYDFKVRRAKFKRNAIHPSVLDKHCQTQKIFGNFRHCLSDRNPLTNKIRPFTLSI